MRSVLLTANTIAAEEATQLAAVLHDLQKAAFLQIGSRDVSAFIESVADPCKPAAKRLLTRLRKRNRVIDCRRIDVQTCSHPFPCHREIANCDYILGEAIPERIRVDLHNYIGSPLAEALTRTDYTVFDVEKQGYWEQQVFVPLLKYARAVVFVDYLAGEKWIENDAFARSMSWYLDLLGRIGRQAIPKTFFTQCYGDSGRAVATWCRDNGVTLESRRYFSGGVGRSLPHKRLILTDSLGVCIEKGLDILFETEQVRPSGVYVVDDPAEHINQCHRAERC